jgi:hypothetical protein
MLCEPIRGRGFHVPLSAHEGRGINKIAIVPGWTDLHGVLSLWEWGNPVVVVETRPMLPYPRQNGQGSIAEGGLIGSEVRR